MTLRTLLNSWRPDYQKLFFFFVTIFALALLGAVISFSLYPWPVYSWQQLQELQTQELPLYAFERGNLEFTLSAENYVLFERWLGNPIQPNVIALDVYFILFGLSLSALLAILSALPRYWFYAGTTIMAFLIALFRWDALSLAGSGNPMMGIIIVSIFLGVLFFFQFFQSSASFLKRLLAFTVLCALLGIVVNAASPVLQPLRYLAVNTLPIALVLLIIFIMLVAHQIMASFVSLALASSRTHRLRQFLIISTIYLLNLWVAYLDRIGWMDWDYTMSPFLLFFSSSVLAVWTIRQRFPIYEFLFKNEVLLIYFIFAFGTMAFATMGYFISSANDIVLLSLNDFILYTHIGYGMMFLLYVVSNFLGMFEKNLPIPTVLYKPTTMPYFSYRFAGLIVTLALIFYNNWAAHFNHLTSGFYTAMGDIHFGQPNVSAHTAYRQAHVYAPYNQHAATALAALEGANGNYGKEKNYAVDANRFRPTEFTILNADNLFILSGNAYEEIRLLRKGKNLHPASGVIRNNLGLAFARIGMADSAKFYFTEAAKDHRTRRSAEMNVLGLIVKADMPDYVDSVFQLESGSPSVRSNAFALANRQGRTLSAKVKLPKDSILDIFSASLLANYLTNQTNQIDSAFLSTCVLVAQKEKNLSFRHMILQSAAKACYASGQVNRAFSLLQEAIFLGSSVGPNNYALGLMAMDQEKHDVALSYFLYALNNRSVPAAQANAVSLAEVGRIDEALVAWDTLGNRKDTTLQAVVESMKRVLGAPPSWFPDLSERERLYYARYRIPLHDSILFSRLVGQIKNEDFRAKAFLHRARQYFADDELSLSVAQYKNLQGLHLTDTRLFAEIKYFELRLLASQGRMDDLQAIIKQGILFGPYRESERVYYEALKQEASGDMTAAGRNFEWLARNNWYFDDGIVAASRFFKRDSRKSYGILADALQVNPRSAKILKAYIPVALARGFDPYAVNALETLRGILAPTAFQKYVNQNQLSGLLLQ